MGGRRIALVCGEASGDSLGAGLAAELRRADPQIELAGVAGPGMRAAGVECWLDSGSFAVMGYLAALARLPSLIRARNRVRAEIERFRPRVFVGIDAPDLNMGLGRFAASLGARYVQYVCPSFWRWRRRRASALARDCARVLALLPFEAGHCEAEGIPASFVGHRLADELPEDPGRRGRARAELGIGERERVLALLPGSRPHEIASHAGLFAEAARICAARTEGLSVWMAPLAGAQVPQLPGVRCRPGAARELLAAADAALVKSGTATLEAALLGCPQVVAYRTSALSSAMFRWRLGDLHSQHFSLPNLIAGERLVPELLQERAEPQALAGELQRLLGDGGAERMRAGYRELRSALGGGADAKAAAAVLEVEGA